MAEDLDQIVDNLKQTSAWIRVLIMVGFAIVLYILIAPVIFVLMLAQALFVLITGDSNQNLKYLGASLAQYVLQILNFLSYNSDQRPFPFSDFPGEFEDMEINKDEKAANAAASAVKSSPKTAAKKKTAKRKAAAKKSKSSANKAADVESGSPDG